MAETKVFGRLFDGMFGQMKGQPISGIKFNFPDLDTPIIVGISPVALDTERSDAVVAYSTARGLIVPRAMEGSLQFYARSVAVHDTGGLATLTFKVTAEAQAVVGSMTISLSIEVMPLVLWNGSSSSEMEEPKLSGNVRVTADLFDGVVPI